MNDAAIICLMAALASTGAFLLLAKDDFVVFRNPIAPREDLKRPSAVLAMFVLIGSITFWVAWMIFFSS